jgi:hypothetical protein
MTAQANKGMCVPCKMGTREAIDAGIIRNKEEREREKTDPFRRLWLTLVHRVYETPEGFNGLSEVEREYFAVGCVDLELYNGGFHQYFFNSSADHYKYAVQGFVKMGGIHSLALLQQAKEVVFASAEVPEITGFRRIALSSLITESMHKALAQLDHKYCQDPDKLESRLDNFARANGLV